MNKLCRIEKQDPEPVQQEKAYFQSGNGYPTIRCCTDNFYPPSLPDPIPQAQNQTTRQNPDKANNWEDTAYSFVPLRRNEKGLIEDYYMSKTTKEDFACNYALKRNGLDCEDNRPPRGYLHPRPQNNMPGYCDKFPSPCGNNSSPPSIPTQNKPVGVLPQTANPEYFAQSNKPIVCGALGIAEAVNNGGAYTYQWYVPIKSPQGNIGQPPNVGQLPNIPQPSQQKKCICASNNPGKNLQNPQQEFRSNCKPQQQIQNPHAALADWQAKNCVTLGPEDCALTTIGANKAYYDFPSCDERPKAIGKEENKRNMQINPGNNKVREVMENGIGTKNYCDRTNCIHNVSRPACCYDAPCKADCFDGPASLKAWKYPKGFPNSDGSYPLTTTYEKCPDMSDNRHCSPPEQ